MSSSPRTSVKRRRNRSEPQKPMNTTIATVSSLLNNTAPACSTQPAPVTVLHNFPLLDLPAELRNEFYRACLKRPYSLHIHNPRDIPALSPAPSDDFEPLPGIVYISPPRSPSPVNSNDTTDSDNQQLGQADCLIPALLRTNKQIYDEARAILYQENTFTLHIDTALTALSRLPQRSRSLIRHVRLRIRTHREILDKFTEIVRLGLRYCWSLRTFVITLPDACLDDGWMNWSGSARRDWPDVNIYANAFHILRWLPRGCAVLLEEGGDEGGAEKGKGKGKGKDGWRAVRRVVEEHQRLVGSVDEKSYTAIQFYPADAGLA